MIILQNKTFHFTGLGVQIPVGLNKIVSATNLQVVICTIAQAQVEGQHIKEPRWHAPS
jgi:hypothetical protein